MLNLSHYLKARPLIQRDVVSNLSYGGESFVELETFISSCGCEPRHGRGDPGYILICIDPTIVSTAMPTVVANVGDLELL